MKKIDELCINNIRVIGVESIAKAKSGHPGIVLGAAPILHTLYTRVLNIDPLNPNWFDRDRFVLSAGHGSALLYTINHLAGFDVTMDDIKNFRQKDSRTPGHPEYKHTDGIELTTGPLGQGLSTAVGMAISEAYLASKFNKLDNQIINHYTYVLCGDGDLQEGITQEAMSLAGHLGLGKLIVLYDSNDIQLDGDVSLANTEDVKTKYESMNWQYIKVCDGNDVDEIEVALKNAKRNLDQPTIIEIKTIIGYGAPNSGDNSVHGKPLSEEELLSLKEFFEYKEEPFTVNSEVNEYYKEHVINHGADRNTHWNLQMQDYEQKYKKDYDLLLDFIYENIELKDLSTMPTYEVGSKESTRNVMGKVLNWIQNELPNTLGGSADLTSSTMVKGVNGIFDKDNLQGRDIRFGVREHAMAAITNGITVHGGLRGFCAAFFVFSDYLKPAVRLAAIMGLNSMFFFSHDTVCVGEDGPTHQPIEQLTMFRSTPNLNTIRPADANEMTAALLIGFETKTNPTVIVSTRQAVTNLACTNYEGVKKGAYIAFEPKKSFSGIIITCGSELELAIEVAKKLEEEGNYVRVVSMPSMFAFDKQSIEYKESILPKKITKRFAFEMGSTMPWYKYSQNVFGIDTFGSSMPIKHIASYYGFTLENIYKLYKEIE